jgi:hypothetical protein
MAALMVCMAIALECCKPLAVASAFNAFRSFALVRGAALTLLAVVAVAYSLTAELTLMATARGDLVAQRAASAKAARSTNSQRDRIEAELARLAGVRPAATVRAEITGLLADPRVGDCRALDGPRSKVACPKVAALRAELGNAERKEQLEADLANLQPVGPPVATDRPTDPGAHAMSTYLAAIGIVLPDRLLTEWFVLVGVIALELGAALAMVLVQAVATPITGHETAAQIEQKWDSSASARPVEPLTNSPGAGTRSIPSLPVSGPAMAATKKRTPCKAAAADSPASADWAT